jgi:hypothetical protein
MNEKTISGLRLEQIIKSSPSSEIQVVLCTFSFTRGCLNISSASSPVRIISCYLLNCTVFTTVSVASSSAIKVWGVCGHFCQCTQQVATYGSFLRLYSPNSDVSCEFTSSAGFSCAGIAHDHQDYLRGSKLIHKSANVSKCQMSSTAGPLFGASSPLSRFGYHNFVGGFSSQMIAFEPYSMSVDTISRNSNFISNSGGISGNALIFMASSSPNVTHTLENCVFVNNTVSCFFRAAASNDHLSVVSCKFDVVDPVTSGIAVFGVSNTYSASNAFLDLSSFAIFFCPTPKAPLRTGCRIRGRSSNFFFILLFSPHSTQILG